MNRLTLLAVTLLAACSGGTDVSVDQPRLGRYSYQFEATGLNASGTMVLTYAAPDSIAGRFEVPGYTPVFDLGNRNGSAYIVYAHRVGGGLAQHRFRLDGQDLVCE